MATGAPLSLRAAAGWSPAAAAALVSACSATVVLIAAAAGALAPGASLRAGPALLVVAGLVALPHGAVDHLALGWARAGTGSAGTAVVVAYAAAALLAAGLALAVPLTALLVLLVLSGLHFAEGERAFDRLRGGSGRALPAAALGTVVVVVPLVLRPVQSRSLLAALDPRLPQIFGTARIPMLAGTAVLVLVALGVALRAGDRRVAAELALVAAGTVLAPPLLIFAAWFGGWHAPRHIVRLLALEPSGDGPARLRRLVRGAALPTAAALIGTGGLALLLHGLPGAVLVALLALTVPHAAVVARLDHAARGAGAAPRGSPGQAPG